MKQQALEKKLGVDKSSKSARSAQAKAKSSTGELDILVFLILNSCRYLGQRTALNLLVRFLAS